MSWFVPPDSLDIQPHQADVWRLLLAPGPDSLRSARAALSADESERAALFHFDKDRNRFILAHASLRNILSRYIHRPLHEVEFSVDAFGKPSLVSDADISFNLSHSGDYALIAVARTRKVGIDVERIRHEMEFESLARRFFSPAEVTGLMSVPPEQRSMAFYNGWTRKEAYIKAHGLGLSLPLDSFDVSLSPKEPASLRATRPDPREAARWALFPLEVAPGYAGALVVELAVPDGSTRELLEIRHWDWGQQSAHS